MVHEDVKARYGVDFSYDSFAENMFSRAVEQTDTLEDAAHAYEDSMHLFQKVLQAGPTETVRNTVNTYIDEHVGEDFRTNKLGTTTLRNINFDSVEFDEPRRDHNGTFYIRSRTPLSDEQKECVVDVFADSLNEYLPEVYRTNISLCRRRAYAGPPA